MCSRLEAFRQSPLPKQGALAGPDFTDFTLIVSRPFCVAAATISAAGRTRAGRAKGSGQQRRPPRQPQFKKLRRFTRSQRLFRHVSWLMWFWPSVPSSGALEHAYHLRQCKTSRPHSPRAARSKLPVCKRYSSGTAHAIT